MPNQIKSIIDRHFFRPAWYSVVINPYFIARRGLLKKIKKFAQADFSKKNILDVGCGIKPYAGLFKSASYTGIDIMGGGHRDQAKIVDQFYNGLDIPFPDESYEAIICTEVLEHAASPERLLSEIKRVLKKDGVLFLTMPLVWNEHEIPYDFRRFTRYGHQELFKKVGLNIQSLEETCGVFRVCGQLISAFIFERLFFKNKILKLLCAISLCGPIQIFFIILDCIFKNTWLTLGYAITAKK